MLDSYELHRGQVTGVGQLVDAQTTRLTQPTTSPTSPERPPRGPPGVAPRFDTADSQAGRQTGALPVVVCQGLLREPQRRPYVVAWAPDAIWALNDDAASHDVVCLVLTSVGLGFAPLRRPRMYVLIATIPSRWPLAWRGARLCARWKVARSSGRPFPRTASGDGARWRSGRANERESRSVTTTCAVGEGGHPGWTEHINARTKLATPSSHANAGGVSHLAGHDGLVGSPAVLVGTQLGTLPIAFDTRDQFPLVVRLDTERSERPRQSLAVVLNSSVMGLKIAGSAVRSRP